MANNGEMHEDKWVSEFSCMPTYILVVVAVIIAAFVLLMI